MTYFSPTSLARFLPDDKIEEAIPLWTLPRTMYRGFTSPKPPDEFYEECNKFWQKVNQVSESFGDRHLVTFPLGLPNPYTEDGDVEGYHAAFLAYAPEAYRTMIAEARLEDMNPIIEVPDRLGDLTKSLIADEGNDDGEELDHLLGYLHDLAAKAPKVVCYAGETENETVLVIHKKPIMGARLEHFEALYMTVLMSALEICADNVR